MTSTTTLARLDAAGSALAAATTPEEIQPLRDSLAAIERLLRQRGHSRAEQNRAAELRLRAERKLGAWLEENVRPGNPRNCQAARQLPPGISRTQALIWRNESKVLDFVFERYVADTLADENGELTTRGLLRLGAEFRAWQREHPLDDAEQFCGARESADCDEFPEVGGGAEPERPVCPRCRHVCPRCVPREEVA